MLTAAIVYVQGSGGNLLARALSLDPKTVAYLPENLAIQQSTYSLDSAERLAWYNNWNAQNWTHTEKEIDIWYHTGLTDFVNYETSELKLIDRFHPLMFENETKQATLWDSVNRWQHVIFIKYQDASLDKIIQLAKLKRTDLTHRYQIPKEIESFQRLTASIPKHLDIWWEDLLHLDSFISSVKNIAFQINIEFNVDLATTLWQDWHKNTTLLTNE